MTYRALLYDLALGQRGYVTSHDASSIGVPVRELNRLAARGGLQRLGYGVYRFEPYPPDARDEFLEAVLLVGPDAFLSHDAVLALHDLADVNPRSYKVASRRLVRRTLPGWIEVLHRPDLPDEFVTVAHDVPTTTLTQALHDCVGIVPADRLDQARTEATREGLLPARPAASSATP